MSIQIVLQQMLIIFILILTGAFLYHRKIISSDTSTQLSSMVIHLCNPAHLIHSAISSESRISLQHLLTAMALTLMTYGILILCSYLLPRLLRIPDGEVFCYRLLTVYGNVGFIGIPLVSAVLGSSALIYVSLNNLVYNILIYTHGFSVIQDRCASSPGLTAQAAAGTPMQIPSSPPADDHSLRWTGISFSGLISGGKKFINPGTVSAMITIFLYLSNIRLPVLIEEPLYYIGRSTTFLSMLILGVSIARMSPAQIFSNFRLYPFLFLRLTLLPVLCSFLFRIFTQDALLLRTLILLMAVPAGNMPLILARQQKIEAETLSQGILLSTILSLITIPVVIFLGSG